MTLRPALPTTLPAVALLGALTLAACGSDTGSVTDAGAAATGAGEVTTLKVAVTPVPHAAILEFVDEKLARQAGLDIEIVEFTDYVQPNQALADGDVDANYFQHSVYLANQVEAGGFDLVSLGSVSFQPMGLYSRAVEDLADLPQGATVAIPNDPTNGSRGLDLLEEAGLLTYAEDAPEAPSVADIAENPKDLTITEVEAAQLPRSLEDVDVAAVPGNYAIDAKLDVKDALAAEEVEGTPYANQLVVRREDEEDPALRKLYELLTSEETKAFIDETYRGAVVQATS